MSLKLSMVSKSEKISVKQQCQLLGINRTSFYYKPKKLSEEQLAKEAYLRRRIDFWHTKHCYMGHRTIAKKLKKEDNLQVGKKLVKRLMQEMNVYAVYPKPNLSKPRKGHKKFPYLLKNLPIFLPNQVWAIDITYIPMGRSHMYLTAIIDWHSRFIVGWSLSDTLETSYVIQAVEMAIGTYGVPGILNSDQGSQFTSDEYISLLAKHKIRQSMDGKARWVDNVIVERWFRSLKCDNIYINDYITPKMLRLGINSYINEYNNERPHQSLGYEYPSVVHGSYFAKSAA